MRLADQLGRFQHGPSIPLTVSGTTAMQTQGAVAPVALQPVQQPTGQHQQQPWKTWHNQEADQEERQRLVNSM